MILFIDCYDSFSYNLIRLIERVCSCEVKVVHNDSISMAELEQYIPSFEAIVIGPGPGNPVLEADAHIIPDLIEYLSRHPVPLLGICFGFQSLVLKFGGSIKRLDPPVHGQVSKVQLESPSELFKGIPNNFEVVRYHSLCSAGDSDLIVTATADGIEMAVEHPELPFYAAQFHPESILSTYGDELVSNFWKQAVNFNLQTKRVNNKLQMPLRMCEEYVPFNIKAQSTQDITLQTFQVASPKQAINSIAKILGNGSKNDANVTDYSNEFVCLQSQSYPGKWTIFGNLTSNTLHIRSKNDEVFCGKLNGDYKSTKDQSVFQKLVDEMQPYLLAPEIAEKYMDLPFVGGFMGYITYEGGCQYTTNLGTSTDSGMHSDVSMVFIKETVLVKESTKEVYVVGSSSWCQEFKEKFDADLNSNSDLNSEEVSRKEERPVYATSVTKPEYAEYSQQFNECMEKLRSGDSYELCLTTPTTVILNTDNTWDIFCHIVDRNPAPYCSFLAFDDILLATSPERFMAFDDKKCEFRPIKGTVKKRPGVTLESATEILKTPKEQAENLMIVDLIRHDLQHLLHNVNTPQLMQVEEYHTVYQLVTSIEGEFKKNDEDVKINGFDILVESLPPGSMTGAPKKRSVELLRSIEPKPRGIYSGVHGYWSIHGKGDWSVVIRSMFRNKTSPANRYNMGAGGAITVLSTCEGEFEEMETKIDSVLSTLTSN